MIGSKLYLTILTSYRSILFQISFRDFKCRISSTALDDPSADLGSSSPSSSPPTWCARSFHIRFNNAMVCLRIPLSRPYASAKNFTKESDLDVESHYDTYIQFSVCEIVAMIIRILILFVVNETVVFGMNIRRSIKSNGAWILLLLLGRRWVAATVFTILGIWFILHFVCLCDIWMALNARFIIKIQFHNVGCRR